MNLHGEIMNIKYDKEALKKYDDLDDFMNYKLGHRDARHAAAELAVSLDAKYAALLASHRELLAALERIRPVPERILERLPVACLDEVLAGCDRAISRAEALGGE